MVWPGLTLWLLAYHRFCCIYRIFVTLKVAWPVLVIVIFSGLVRQLTATLTSASLEGIGVAVGVAVAVFVGVLVGVFVGVAVAVGVSVGVLVGVGVAVFSSATTGE